MQIKKLKTQKLIAALIIDLSFFPQAVWAALLCFNLMNNGYFSSRILIYNHYSYAILISCAAIVILALLSVMKRFYFIRLLLLSAYAAFVTSVLLFRFSGIYAACFSFAGVGVAVTLLNAVALYKYRKLNNEIVNLAE